MNKETTTKNWLRGENRRLYADNEKIRSINAELVAALRDCEKALTRYFMDFDHLHPTIQEPLYAARALLAKLGEG